MRSWSPAAEDKLRRLYATTPRKRLAFLLKRTESAIKSRATLLGLEKANRKVWTKAEDRTLRKRFPHEPTKAIARDFGCAPQQVSQRASKLGLHKTEAYLASEAHKAPLRENGRTNLAVKNAGFKKGHVPANKGLRRPGWAPGRMAETQFKKGERTGAAHRNWVPIGTEKYDPKRGNIVRKFTDDPAIYPAGRWKPVARIVWEEAHGPIPADCVVRFKKGMKTLVSAEITLDRLELVTLAENLSRNSHHNNYPKEISLAIHAKGVLRRAINKANRGTTP